MSPEEIQQLFDYNSWANRRLLDAAEKLTSEQFTKPLHSSFTSVRDTLAHIYGAEFIWLERFQGGAPPMPPADRFPDLKTLRAAWVELDERLLEFARKLTQSGLNAELNYKTFTMGVVRDPLCHAMQHLVNHSTYHRGQVTTLLRQLGVEAVSTDLIRFYRDRARAQSA